MDNLSGQVIKGYELQERIGAGGFGAVYRAYQSTVGREVAIKIILPGFANHPDFIRRFEAEAQIIARLEHLHIVPLYDYWREPNGAYLVMRWLRGGSLRDALQTNGPYDLEGAASLLDQIVSALAAAHQQHIIHRDLKPGNVLLDEDGNAYLADFGIAKDLTSSKESTTQNDAIIGSPDYLSPEQARSETVTPQTDIYSLGVMLYELLAGQHPFPNASTVQRLYSHLNDPLPPVDNLPRDVNAAVNTVIQKATMKNPAQRYANAPALAAAFREAIALNAADAPADVVEVLTPREQEILRSMIEGRSNKEIAAQLFVTVATVKWYITQIYRKLGVRSRVQAIVRARELNLITDGFRPVQEDALSEATFVPTDTFQPENPYKGLLPFQTADYRDFFGREKLVEKLIRRLGETDDASRFLAVIGPSGSGKSSLVKAGLIPALWRGDLPGSERWFVVEMLPGARPLDELEVALTRVAAIPAVNLREHLTRDKYGLLRAANLVLPNDGSEFVVVIDQFEEVFTLLDDENARVHFLNLLHAAVIEPRSRVRVVITLRADFYDRPLHYPEFGELVRSRMETILPLSAQGMERAIAGPAERVGVAFEEGLVAQIIEDMHYQTGALPLLQYALTELFERRQGRLLTHAAFQDMGGAVGALAKRAEDLYREFNPDGQETIRQMFLRLVTLGEGAEDTRRRVHRSELLAITSDQEMMEEIIDTFVAYRLLSLDHDPITRSPTVEVAHEAILHEWERLSIWLDESRSEIRLQRQLARAAQDWDDSGRDASFLLRGTRLDQFQAWAGQTQLAFTPLETTYLQASVAAHEEAQAAALAQQAREMRLERRAQIVLRGLVAVFLVATIVASGLAVLAFGQRRIAQHNAAEANRNAALSQSLALASAARAALSEDNTDQALALAVAANQINTPPAFAQRTLYDAAFAPGTVRRIRCDPGSTDWCWAMAVSPDGLTVVTTGDRPDITLSDIATGQQIRRFTGGHTDAVQSVAFLPDGQSLLSGSLDDTLLLWDIASGKILRRYENPTGDINSINVSPDGRLAITGTEGGEAVLWNLESGEIVHRFVHNPAFQIQPVAFSPDGALIVSGSEDGTIVLWNTQTGELVRRFEGHTNIVFDVVFSPDGRVILSSSADNTMILWDLESGERLRQFTGHTNWVFKARFSADGTRIISASRDQSLILWDALTGEVLHVFAGEAGGALSVAFVPQSHLIISAHSTGYLRVWETDDQRILWQVQDIVQSDGAAGMDDTLNSDGELLALDVSGRQVLTGSEGDNAVVLWDVDTGDLVGRFAGLHARVSAVAFSPDGRFVLGGGWDGSLVVWARDTGDVVRRFEGHTAGVLDAAFSPDSSRIVSGSEDRSLILWDTSTGEVILQLDGFTDSVNTVAFSPDGRTFLAGFGLVRYAAGSYSDTSLRLFEASSGEEIRRFEGHTAPVTTAAFSPDGRTILSGSTDATVRLWDVATGQELRRFNGHAAAIWDVNYSPDGYYVVSGSQDTTVIVWELSSGEQLRVFANGEAMIQGVVFTPDSERLLFVTADGALRVWQPVLNLNELRSWTLSNRYVRELSCSEQELYRLSSNCDPEE
jgi:WD40 repeat protein/serine/threonine protein kinase